MWKIANTITEDSLVDWIFELVNREYGGEESSTEGWCGPVSGDIYKHLKLHGEQPEIWGVVDWNHYSGQQAIIDKPTDHELRDVQDQTSGVIMHSFVKWNGKFWDGKGCRTLDQIMDQHGFGVSHLGKGQSIMREF